MSPQLVCESFVNVLLLCVLPEGPGLYVRTVEQLYIQTIVSIYPYSLGHQIPELIIYLTFLL